MQKVKLNIAKFDFNQINQEVKVEDELVKKEEMQQQQQNEMNMQLIYSCFCLNLI